MSRHPIPSALILDGTSRGLGHPWVMIGIIIGLYRGYMGVMEKKMETTERGAGKQGQTILVVPSSCPLTPFARTAPQRTCNGLLHLKPVTP